MKATSPAPKPEVFIGCLLGGALGDALGYPVEFDGLAEIRDRLGVPTPRDLTHGHAKVAVVSDDTQMTLFTAEGMIRAIQRHRDRGICNVAMVVQGAFLRWLQTQKPRSDERERAEWRGWLLGEVRLHVQRAPGNTCLSALEAARSEGARPRSDKPINDSKGCGAVMRAAPVGLAASSRREAFEMGRDTGALTHGHPSGYLAAAYLSALIFDLVRGVPITRALDDADALLCHEREHQELLQKIAVARELARSGPPTPETVERLGGGWVGEEALAIGLLCALTADSRTPAGVADALWRAVLHSGDSDSTGSITGNLLGAMVGASGLPDRWLGQLELREVIERIANDLYRAAVEGVVLDHVAYPPN